ncbi:MAG: T9SS type A sorting domain-containing protein [Saprospiraceae bacterium]|nr:T9SS type A sorting domain-containing protein [Saprospiraceae bacterium]
MKKNLLITAIFFVYLPILVIGQNNGAGCARAIPATLGSYTVDTMFAGVATFSSLDPYPTRAIWYKYTPPTDGLMTISTCGSGADTRLALFTGSCSGLASAGYNDDYCDADGTGREVAASIAKPVKAGTPYYFEFDNAWDTLDFSFSLTLTPFTPRATQTCATATTIALGVTKVDSLFGYASRSDASRANWYKFVPNRNGKVSINTCGDDVDTRLWVYRGTCAALVPVADSDDDCASPSGVVNAVSIQNMDVTAGQTYYFEFDDVGENIEFSIAFSYDIANNIANTRLSQAINLSPNPAIDVVDLNVDLDKTSNLSIRIINTVGQHVANEKITQILRGASRLDVSTLKSGIYIVEISDGIAKTRKKLVINR